MYRERRGEYSVISDKGVKLLWYMLEKDRECSQWELRDKLFRGERKTLLPYINQFRKRGFIEERRREYISKEGRPYTRVHYKLTERGKKFCQERLPKLREIFRELRPQSETRTTE
jgi:DNA-binding PadR family transcriptional regulator